MRKYCVLDIFIVLQLFCSAQKDTLHKRGVEPGTISINAGIGYSTIFYAANGIMPSEIARAISISPAYNLGGDYSLTRRSSMGICITYQQLVENPVDDNGEVDKWEVDNLSRVNIGFRYLLHLSKSANSDAYIGVRSGCSYWIEDITTTASGTNGYIVNTPGISTYADFSIQFLFGYRAYVSRHLAFQFEAGIGTPYLLEGGLAYRFSTAKQ